MEKNIPEIVVHRFEEILVIRAIENIFKVGEGDAFR